MDAAAPDDGWGQDNFSSAGGSNEGWQTGNSREEVQASPKVAYISDDHLRHLQEGATVIINNRDRKEHGQPGLLGQERCPGKWLVHNYKLAACCIDVCTHVNRACESLCVS